MEVEFYRCYNCGRMEEKRILLKRPGCTCGAMRVRPTIATRLELLWFAITHPSYIVKDIVGEK